MHNLEYNTSKDDLILKEYGRNIQKLAAYVVSLPDMEKRTSYAYTLIELMKQINPSMKDSPEYTQRLWDDLYIMSEFKLEVDSPYPLPEKELLGKKPKKIDYNSNEVKYRHYGRNVELMIDNAVAIEDEEEQRDAVIYIARLMKSFYATWNKEVIEDEVILEHLQQLSENKLKMDVSTLKNQGLLDQNQGNNRSRNPKNKRPSGSFKSNSNNKRKRN